jgi:DNA-binding transcriptional ArsR family regulator
MGGLCNEMKKFGKGIGNASRYQIVEALLKGRKTVGELVKIVGISQPATPKNAQSQQHSDCGKERARSILRNKHGLRACPPEELSGRITETKKKGAEKTWTKQ